jgi:hypothetical protein
VVSLGPRRVAVSHLREMISFGMASRLALRRGCAPWGAPGNRHPLCSLRPQQTAVDMRLKRACLPRSSYSARYTLLTREMGGSWPMPVWDH